MSLGTSQAWGVVLPVEKTNYAANPSFERGTSGVIAIAGATIGTDSGRQQFGAWSALVIAGVNGTTGAAFGTWTASLGSTYTVSAYIRPGPIGSTFTFGIGDSNGVNFVGSTNYTAGGTWHRYSHTFTEQTGAVRRLVVRGTNVPIDYYLDGYQIEDGSITTYLDGDQPGCYWTGLFQASPSTRSGTYRGGGSVVSLNDLGLVVNDSPGIGMPALDTTSQSYALTDGAAFQRQRAAVRSFALNSYIAGTSRVNLHQQRQTIIDALKIDLVSPQQPTTFWYVGGPGTVQISAVIDSGLEYGAIISENGFTESPGVRFKAFDPFWYDTTDQGTTLAPRTAIGSANAILRRDPLGRWGTMGVHGTSVAGTVDTLYMAPTGTLFVGGRITTFDGTANSRGLAMYFPSTNRFGSMGGTTTPGAIYNVLSFQYAPWGTLYFGGDFSGISGTTTRFLGQWNGAFGSLVGGTVNGRVDSIKLSQSGTLFVGGTFQTAAGTTSPRLALWKRTGAFGSLVGQAGGTVDADVYEIGFGLDQTLYFTGAFGSAGGTALSRIGQWKNSAFGSMGSGLQWTVAGYQGNALAVGPNGILTIGGYFGTAGGVTGTHVAQWNGVSYTIPAGGLGTNEFNQVWKLATHPVNGFTYAVGLFSANANNLPFPDGMAFYNNYTWIPLDVDTPTDISSGGIVNAIAFGIDNSIYIGGQWVGTAYGAAVAQIISAGATDTYPTFIARNTSAGTARIYQLINTLTGDGLYFNLSLMPGETVTLMLTPSERTFTSDIRGNIFSTILPGSQLSTFRVAPGTNYISLFADNDNMITSFYWRRRLWSADGASVIGPLG